MADEIFNVGLGTFVEKFNDSAANGIVMLMKANEAEATLVDRTDIADILVEGGNTETIATDYARKTGLTGTPAIDNTNDRAEVDLPDQTWTAIGNGTNETLTKAIVCYEDAAADATRIPMSHHDFAITTSNNDLTIQFAATGFGRAQG